DRAAERIAGKIRAALSRRDSNMTAYNYKLSLCGLTREERAGIESELLQMSGYVSHLPLFTDNTRAEWKYVSRFGAEELVRKLDATIENEGLEVDVVPLSNGNPFPEYLSDMVKEDRNPCDI
ncbi:MAG: hypothetical protein OXI10_06015, partial [Gammaproteobacteria bacterium]|nr:hypothetical protein [Gammaproteobacteria bacterium]